MRRLLERWCDAAFGLAVLAAIAALVVGLRPDDSPGAPFEIRPCARPDCPWPDHSPEAAARAEARDRTLATLGVIDLDDRSDFTPPEHRPCEVAVR